MPYQIHTNKSWDETMRDLRDTMEKWRVRSWSVDPVKPGRRPVTNRVSITFTLRNGEEKLVTLGSQPTPRDNLRALALSLEDMRMVEVRGLGDVYKQVYGAALAPAATTLPTGPYAVLGVRPDAPWEVVEAAYRARVRVIHPDAPGGSTAAAAALNSAMDAIRKERGR